MRRRRQAGITVVELLLALAMTAILAGAICYAFSAAIDIHRRHILAQGKSDTTAHMEQEVTRLIEGAALATSTTDKTSYFMSDANSTTNDLGCDRMTFTTTGAGVPMASMYSADDYETQQSAQGPVGGLAEVSLGTTAVGDPGDKTGLFERIQRPSDSDATQGGQEFVLDPEVDSIGFEFYDGSNWETSWDTTTGSRRLPQAVQVSYTLKDDPDHTTHLFVVSIPASNVNSLNPYVTTTTGSAS